MTSKLYINNVGRDVTETQLQELFASVGVVRSVILSTDHQTGARKTYAFVEMESPEAAGEAVIALDGHTLNKRPIRVTQLRDAEQHFTQTTDNTDGFRQRGWGSRKQT